MPHSVATRIARALREFLAGRRNLEGLVLLIDARRGPQREERDLAASARERGLTMFAVATKCDKLRRSQRSAALSRMHALDAEPLLLSARTGEGVEVLRRRVLAAAR